MNVVMDVMTQAELIERIDAFLERHEMGDSRFGRDAVGEPGLVERIRNGSSPNLRTLGRIAAFMAERDAATDSQQADAA
jgi:hypothetical protein